MVLILPLGGGGGGGGGGKVSTKTHENMQVPHECISKTYRAYTASYATNQLTHTYIHLYPLGGGGGGVV